VLIARASTVRASLSGPHCRSPIGASSIEHTGTRRRRSAAAENDRARRGRLQGRMKRRTKRIARGITSGSTQPRVVAGKASLVLAHADVDHCSGGDVPSAADGFAAAKDEVVVLRLCPGLGPTRTIDAAGDANPLPDEIGPTERILAPKRTRRNAGRLRRCQATQFTKKRI